MVTSCHLSTFSLQTPPSTNAPSPLVVFCANSNANANAIVNNVLFVAAFSSLQALRNLITQKYENLKSADNISTHGRAEVIDLVERVRFEIRYLVPRSSFKTVVGGRSARPSPRPRPGGIRKRQGPKRENGNGEDGSSSRSRSEEGCSGRGVPGGY